MFQPRSINLIELCELQRGWIVWKRGSGRDILTRRTRLKELLDKFISLSLERYEFHDPAPDSRLVVPKYSRFRRCFPGTLNTVSLRSLSEAIALPFPGFLEQLSAKLQHISTNVGDALGFFKRG